MTVRDTLSELGVWTKSDVTLEAAPTMASPSWWGADSECYSARGTSHDPVVGNGAFVKAMAPHARFYVDVACACAAATEAGERGIGPAVYIADAERAILVMEDFTGISHTATLDLFNDMENVEKLVALRKSVGSLTSITRTAGIFDDLDRLQSLCSDIGAALPPDFDWMMRSIAPARARIDAAGFDAVPCHGDANISNVLLLDEDASMRLVDWDLCAVVDPLQDLGSLLTEIRPFDVDAREVFEMSWGHFDGKLFDRCRIYGIADCLRGALIGAYADAVRPGTLEYSKFADWQFLRARAGLRDPHFDDRTRNL